MSQRGRVVRYWPDIKLFVVELWLRALLVPWFAWGWTIAEAVRVWPEGCPILRVPPGGKVVLGGTAGAGELTLLSGLLARGLHAAPAGPELFAGWLTCSRFLRVTNSVLKLFNRCCRCTASLDDEASANQNYSQNFNWVPNNQLSNKPQANFFILINYIH